MPVVAATAFHIGNGLKGAESNASECPSCKHRRRFKRLYGAVCSALVNDCVKTQDPYIIGP